MGVEPNKVLRSDWGGKPTYRNQSGQVLNNEFFGGDFKGILSKLEYLKELGVTVIYLNPISKAYSSHRYDTGDYLTPDPLLGTEDELIELLSQAKKLGISFIFDGVYNHTGADSKYFNRYSTYPPNGAFNTPESPYFNWYNFDYYPYRYSSWWNFETLPSINKDCRDYQDFICNKVLPHYFEMGFKGVRLDVADELSSKFIESIRKVAKSYGAVVIGEVWEDASNKCSYGSYRDFMLGNTHDSVMGSTFRHILLDFLCGYIDADIADTRFEGFRERYPKEAYYAMMNLVSSHDVPRIMTMLSKPCDTDDRDVQRGFKVASSEIDMIASLSKMAFAFQTCYIGASCIYYGDEILMEGYKDPFNRRTYPWNKIGLRQQESLVFFRRIGGLRAVNQCLKTGYYQTLMAEYGTFAFVRYLREGKDAFGNEATGSKAIVLVMNRSDKPIYVDVTEHFGVYSCRNSEEDGIRTPLSEQLIIGGTSGGTRKLGIKPYSVVFLVY